MSSAALKRPYTTVKTRTVLSVRSIFSSPTLRRDFVGARQRQGSLQVSLKRLASVRDALLRHSAHFFRNLERTLTDFGHSLTSSLPQP